MADQNNTELISFENWTLRVRSTSVRPARFLVMLHGFRDDENSMWAYADDLPPEYWIIAPRAPHAVEQRGYSWRPRQGRVSENEVNTFKPEGGPVPSNDDYLNLLSSEMFETSVQGLLKVLDEYGSKVGLNSDQFDMMGFSQGGIMTYLTSLLYPQRVGKAVILGSFLPKNVDALIASQPLQGKPFFVAHGTYDQKVPIAFAHKSIEQLKQAGARVTYLEDSIGHEVSVKFLHAVKAFLQY